LKDFRVKQNPKVEVKLKKVGNWFGNLKLGEEGCRDVELTRQSSMLRKPKNSS
jgi:hypothetical protein